MILQLRPSHSSAELPRHASSIAFAIILSAIKNNDIFLWNTIPSIHSTKNVTMKIDSEAPYRIGYDRATAREALSSNIV